MFDCILLMAGAGKRSKLNYNKIKYEINGKAIFMYSLEAFLKSKYINKVILVCREDEINDFKYLESDKIIITKGGIERQNSVYNGLLKSDLEYVLVHDGARPNITPSDIDRLYETLLTCDCASLAVKENNALKKVKDGLIIEDIDRSDIYLMQTPQGAKREMLKKALETAKKTVYDEVEAMRLIGAKCKIVLGSSKNIKFTDMEDVEYLTYLLGEK